MKTREALVVEARAKVTWGESSESVLAYLQAQGLGDREALPLLQELLGERRRQLRVEGVRKLTLGVGLAAVPVVAYFVFFRLGVIPIKAFSITVVVGLWGVWKAADGFWTIAGAGRLGGEISNLK